MQTSVRCVLSLAWWAALAGALALSAGLGACGGGSGGEPPAPANRTPVASAGAPLAATAGVAVTLDASASADPDGDPLSYAWTIASAPAGSTAALSGATTARPTLTPDQPGTYTVALTVSDGQARSAVATVTVTAAAPVPPRIVADKPEPLAEAVKLSLEGTVRGSVTWYIDLQLLGSGGADGTAAITWDTTRVANGSHLIVALVQTSPGVSEEVRRTVEVSNSTLVLSATASGSTGTIHVDVRASSTLGVASVAASLDGVPAGSLTLPNACSRFCSGTNDVYRFVVDAARAGSGPHTMIITATDASGARKQISVPVPVSNAPILALASPAEGAIVTASLSVVGTVASDKTGPVTVTARLGEVEFLRATTSSFSGSYNLSGLAAGSYTLSVLATDGTGQTSQIQRTVVVASGSALVYTPVFALPAGGRLLAAEGTRLLYATGEGSVIARDAGTGSEVVLAGAAQIQYAGDWQLSAGRAYAYGKGPDCVLYCIYQWAANGTQLNLSTLNPYSRASNIGGGWAYDQHPVAREGYVAWVNDKAADTGVQTDATGRYTVFDTAAGTYTRVGVPAGVRYLGNWNYDLAVVGGVVHFYFWGQTGGDGTTSVFDIFKWRSDTQATTRLTQGGNRSVYVQTDGARAAWQQAPAGGNADNTFALVTQPLAGGAATVASSNATGALLKDGVLTWTESTATAKALKASTVVSTSTLSSLSGSTLYATGGGQVVYGELGKVYSWSAATGRSTLRLETAPSQVLISGGALVFSVGSAVYRVALD